jgi:hypothetical protein
MSMDALSAKLVAFLMSLGAFLGLGDKVEAPVLTNEVKAEIQQLVSEQVQDAMTLYVAQAENGPIFGASQPVAGSTYNLAGSGVSNSATSITLASLKLTQTGQKLQDSDFSSTFYITLEPGNPTKQEITSCTTVTQNANGSATLSGCTRGLSPITPYTASTTLRFSHGGGTSVIFSNPPQFYNEYGNLSDDETVTGQWTFSTFPITPANSACTTTVAGVCELATTAETAAGTILGGAGGNLVIANSTATSTYATSTAPNRVPVTRADGTIDPKFLGTTTVALYPTASVTHGTTTISGSVTLSGGNSNSNIASTSLIVYLATTTSHAATSTWSKPASLRHVIVRVWGGGGGGGGASDATDNGSGGGGGGGYCENIIPVAALASTVTVVAGNGGVGGSGNNAGTTGYTSSFGTHCIATGGSGAALEASGYASPGSGSGGLVNIGGGYGGTRSVATTVTGGGIGGIGAMGGSGGPGAIGPSTEGTTGGSYGGGGGGAWDTDGQTRAGGSGGAGAVVITEVYF